MGLVSIIVVLSSCNGFVKDVEVIDRYHLVAVDTDEGLGLAYKIDSSDNYVGVVSETVFAIGYNNDYIIAKQHPDNNRKIINYFIVPVYKEYTLFPKKGIIGPLTLQQFHVKTQELAIDNLTFTKEIESLK